MNQKLIEVLRVLNDNSYVSIFSISNESLCEKRNRICSGSATEVYLNLDESLKEKKVSEIIKVEDSEDYEIWIERC